MSAFLIVVPPYVLSLLLWAWDGARFIFPIQPQLLFALVVGTYGIAEAVMRQIPAERRWRVAAVASLLGGVLVAEVLMNLRSSSWFVARDVHGADVDWIARETAPDTVLMVPVPTTYYLYLPRNYIPYPRSPIQAQDIVRQIRTYRAKYVIGPAFGIPVNAYVDDRTRTARRLAGQFEQLLAKGVLHPRFLHLPADAVIYQVDAERLALEPE